MSSDNVSIEEYEGKRESKTSSDEGSKPNQLSAGIETCHNDDGRRQQTRHFPDKTDSNIFGEMQSHGTDVSKGTFVKEKNYCGQVHSDSKNVSKGTFGNIFDDMESDNGKRLQMRHFPDKTDSNIFGEMQSHGTDVSKGTFVKEKNYCGQVHSDSKNVSKGTFGNVFDDMESDSRDAYKPTISNVFSEMQSDGSDICKDFRKKKSFFTGTMENKRNNAFFQDFNLF